MGKLFQEKLQVLNVGLTTFGENITQDGGTALNLDWSPPADGQARAGKALSNLVNNEAIELANRHAMESLINAQPTLVSVLSAREAINELDKHKLILHAGPPIEWTKMCGPMQGAVIGAIFYEGWAKDKQDALKQIRTGKIMLASCHHYRAVGPMAGVISPSMPLWVVENSATSNRPMRAFCNFNEGLGKVLRFGANNAEVVERLKWMGTELKQAIQAAILELGKLEIKPLIAQALHMGDEVHNRNIAASGLLMKKLLPALLKVKLPLNQIQRVVDFIISNNHFFLNLSMAAAKCMLDAAANVPNSTLVTAMARNGVNFGVKLSGTGDRWFEAPANPVNGLFFPGYTVDDAAPDLGDSAITETAGLGGFSMAASPAIVKFVGGTTVDAINNSRKMRYITLGSNPAFTLPALNFAPAACGIDARKIVDRSILPIINTGIAHKSAGVGQIGAGITTAPMACFTKAIVAFHEQHSLVNGLVIEKK